MKRYLSWTLGLSSALAVLACATASTASTPTPRPDSVSAPQSETAIATPTIDTSMPAADIAPPTPIEPTKNVGAEVFAKTCGKCHGVDGKGETGIGKKAKEAGKHWPDLTTEKSPVEKVKATIQKGIPDTAMKGYEDKLTAEEVDAVTAFVMALRK